MKYYCLTHSVILLIVFLFTVSSAFSQKQANIWYFGEKTGIDFNVDPPKVIVNSAMETVYSCASIADEGGNLLFYTNGEKVWNKNHEIMVNGEGLLGNVWANQGALIVPHPGSEYLYYLFTVAAFKDPYDKEPAEAINDGLRYSIIDINKNNGLGEVVSKNNLLYAPSTEKLTGVRAADCGFWIITHPYGNDEYWVYKISDAGLVTTPVISKIGFPHTVDQNRVPVALDRHHYSRGQLKCSPDGTKVACLRSVYFGESTLELFDFDAATGKLSNNKVFLLNPNLETNGTSPIHYATEFSPDNTKLYTASVKVWQFDLTEDYPIAVEVGTSRLGESFLNMQLAPDGKIYSTVFGPDVLSDIGSIGVINQPNRKGIASNFVVALQNRFEGRRINFGLPNFIQSYFYKLETDFSIASTCVGEQTAFTGMAKGQPQSWQWNFGDAASGAENVSNLQNPTHTYTQTGEYSVLLVTTLCTQADTVVKKIVVYPDPLVSFPEDTIKVCYDQVPVRLQVPNYPLTNYQWSGGESTASIQASVSGWYKVTASNNCRIRSDSIYLLVTPQATAYLPDDTIVCDGTFALLDAANPGATYRWNTGETTRTIQTDKPGTYWVEIYNECSMAVDTANLVFISEEVGVYTTNVFTPNGDGKNDRFVNYVIRSPQYRFTIVNRWGKVVFESQDPFAYWDGRVNGEEAPTGVYFYYIVTQDCRGQPLRVKGTVSLLR